WIEKNKECREYFGSVAGGSAYKFGLFQKKETGMWTTGSPQKSHELEENEALEVGRNIRDALVKGVEIIRGARLVTLADYEKLDADLKVGIGEQYYNWSWVHKYFSLICNDKLSGFHSDEWQYHVLRALKIQPSEKYYTRSGQIAMIQNYAGWYYRELFDVFFDWFGGPKQFVRLGTSDSQKNYAAEWAKRSVVGIGWSEIGDLTDYLRGDDIDRKEVQDKLKETYYQTDERLASRKAGEITRFYKCNNNTVFVIMDGEHLVAFADEVGDYFFDANSPMAHLRPAKWKFVFSENEKMPEKAEGKMTSCFQLTNESNLMYLYERYYYGEDLGNNLTIDEEPKKVNVSEYKPLNYNTGIFPEYERNRIVFGAPGTGKSFKIKQECENLLAGTNGDYERVTLHPDYTYSQFVGTYKPVTDKDGRIRYTFVPGPFMRVYVNALKSGRTDTPQPYVLVIEEINRAKVAAVFGDVFQLLDRDFDGISEYDIHASEDVKQYLADKLGGEPENYQRIRIPDNMFIWATMNSADQGVFPMDTAFKRRWNFEYLGINENESEIRGKIMLGTSVTQDVEWNVLRRAINEKLAKEYKVNEDKLMGPFFISKKALRTISEEDDTIADTDRFMDIFKSKVIMYLYEDAAKQHKHKLFSGCEDTSKYSAVCDSFDDIGIQIFGEDFEEVYYNPQKG
ncbi:MAG: AAA family ATPase, partial [Lachnospiraceae bacterium]|nr:AAA family ATPase [Lachnospiraceae bacterium]